MNDSQVKSILEKLNKTMEDNSFIIANFKDFVQNHSQPSPVTIEMIKRLDERDSEIIKRLQDIRDEQKQANEKIESDLKDLKTEHDQFKGSLKVWMWLPPSLSSIAGIIFAIISIKFTS